MLQETLRYENPHIAFTFRVHGFESVVGPVKGVYEKPNDKQPSVAKPRDHSILAKDRPHYVNLLTLGWFIVWSFSN